MARIRVDLPTPEGPTIRVGWWAAKAKDSMRASVRPSGRSRLRSLSAKSPFGAGASADALAAVERRMGARDRVVERGQTVEHRLEVGEADVGGDEEAQRRVDLAEGARDLHQRAELDLAEEIERRADDEREVLAHLVVAGGEGGQPFAHVNDAHVIVEDVAETAHRAGGFDRLRRAAARSARCIRAGARGRSGNSLRIAAGGNRGGSASGRSSGSGRCRSPHRSARSRTAGRAR